jgi:hypothetical protein
MKFFGVIEAEGNTPFMLHMPILGLGIDENGRYCMGHITGDIRELSTMGHVAYLSSKDFNQWVIELMSNYPKKDLPKSFNIRVCTYKEACKRALELYDDTMEITATNGPTVKMDLTLIKNKLRNIL